MARPQVPKEQVLEAALQFVLREGHEKLNITSVAKEMNRSTKIISWTFETMEKFRSELAIYALDYFNNKLNHEGDNPVKGFATIGLIYLKMAYEEPNILRFIHANSGKVVAKGGMGFIFDKERNIHLKEALMRYTGMNEIDTLQFMTSVVFYTQGLVTFILDGTISYDKDVAEKMLIECGVRNMMLGGIDKERAITFLNN